MYSVDFFPSRKNVWAVCPNGYFLNGLYRTDGSNLYNIEEGKCCRPQNHPNSYDGCYDEDVTHSFDNKGWSKCKRAGYYLTGIYKSGCEHLYCIEKFRCCKMKKGNWINKLVVNQERRKQFNTFFGRAGIAQW